MIVECDRCYTRYRYDAGRFEGKASKRVRCTRCLAIFEIFNTPAFEAQPSTLAPARPEETVSRLSDKPTTRKRIRSARSPAEELKLPEDAKLSLAVIAGPEAGRIFPLEKPRVIIGRHDADINVDDPEISRQHAAIEVASERATVVDLGSTNGTFVGAAAVSEAPLENQSEFTIGGSTLMLIITPKGSS